MNAVVDFSTALAQFQAIGAQTAAFLARPSAPTPMRVVGVITGLRAHGRKHGHAAGTTSAAITHAMRRLARGAKRSAALREGIAHADALHGAAHAFGEDTQ